MKAGVWLPLFDELADPRVVADLAVDAEAAGWDGLFVWDQIVWRAPVLAVADPWVCLAAAATLTSRIALGPMVSPLSRRRPTKVVRESVSLDRLSRGRLVLGVGLGSDRFAQEYSRTGEPVADRTRAEMLDESLEILRAAWAGQPVHHHGTHHLVDDLTFAPRPVHDTIPVWVAGFPGNPRPLRRAAAHDGFFPVNLTSPDQLAEAVQRVQDLREDPARPFDVAIDLAPGTDPAPWLAAGATWLLTDLDPETLRLEIVRAMVREGPQRPA
ncbi:MULTISPECIES: LLM class flavin-dependent oxidoreductase [unclassified Knoellia]|uniref:LLM class flavin-dependent oxidoreductase n=1 Tax=Knoellia altitudinis TaxID=3404795 RepID=UPI00361F3D03